MNMLANLASPVAAPFRFNVDQFLQLAEQGLFDDYAKSELIEGEIICMNAQYSWHARIKSELCIELGIALRALGSVLRPQVEVSVQLDDYSVPEPDIVLTNYRGKGVVPVANVVLVIEVSDTTLANDLGPKHRLYAQAQVPEYWVIDLNGSRVIRMWQPSGSAYTHQDETPLGDRVASATVMGLIVATEI